jgi:hypothetical protein
MMIACELGAPPLDSAISIDPDRPCSLTVYISLVYVSRFTTQQPGVLLSTGLVHMLSEAVVLFTKLGREGTLGPFFSTVNNATMLANIGCVVGVLVPFMLEKGGLLFFLMQHEGLLGRLCHRNWGRRSHHHASEHDHHPTPHTSEKPITEVGLSPTTPTPAEGITVSDSHDLRRAISADVLLPSGHSTYGATGSSSPNRSSHGNHEPASVVYPRETNTSHNSQMSPHDSVSEANDVVDPLLPTPRKPRAGSAAVPQHRESPIVTPERQGVAWRDDESGTCCTRQRASVSVSSARNPITYLRTDSEESQWGRQHHLPHSKSMVCLVPSVASVILQNRIDLLRGSGFARVVEHAGKYLLHAYRLPSSLAFAALPPGYIYAQSRIVLKQIWYLFGSFGGPPSWLKCDFVFVCRHFVFSKPSFENGTLFDSTRA